MNQTWLTTNQMVFSSLIFLFSFKNTLIDSSNLLHLFNVLYSITRLHVQNAYRNILRRLWNSCEFGTRGDSTCDFCLFCLLWKQGGEKKNQRKEGKKMKQEERKRTKKNGWFGDSSARGWVRVTLVGGYRNDIRESRVGSSDGVVHGSVWLVEESL